MKNPKFGDRVRVYRNGLGKPLDGTVVGIGSEGTVSIRTETNITFYEHRTHLIRLKKKEKPLKMTFICEWWPRFNADKTADIVPADTHGSDFKNEDLKEFQYKRTKVTVEILGE